MAQTIKLRRSATQGGTPTVSQLSLGEVAINTYDGKMYIKKDSGTASIVEIGGGNLPLTGGTLTGNLSLGDNVRARFGTGNDLQIYHNGTNSIIADTGSGLLSLQSNGTEIALYDTANNANMGRFITGGAVNLFYNGNTKFQTTNTGINVTGDITSSGLVTADDLTLEVDGTASELKFVTGGAYRSSLSYNNSTGLMILDNKYSSVDIHAGSGGTSSIRGRFNTSGLTVTGNIGVTGTVDGVDIAARDAVLTSTTTTAGAALPKAGGTLTGSLNFGDNVRAQFGTGNDLQIYHNNDSSYIRDLGEGSLYIDTNGPKISLISDGSYANGKMADFVKDGAVTLYHDNSTKLATTATGIDVTGTVVTDGLTSAGTANVGGLTVNSAFTLPTADGSANQVLKTDGSGNMSWASVAVGAPTYLADADNNTKIQVEESADENKIRFDTAGSERMIIDAAGNVGIGSTAPDKKLVVQGVSAEIVINDIDSTDTPRLRFRESGSTSGSIQTDASHMVFSAGTTERMRITAAGNVGIGNSAPTSYSGYKILHIGNATTSNTGLLKFGTGSTADGPELYASGTSLRMNTSGSVNVLNLVGSNVGIGTTAPAVPLHVNGFARLGGLQLSATTANIVNIANGDLKLGTNNTEKMRITAAGNVGIGTTAPAQKLEVVHSSNATNGIIVQNANTGSAARSNLRLLSDATQLDIYATSSTYSGVSSWTDAGVISTSSNASGGLILNAQSGGIKFQDGTAEIMRISDGGNVGIGTSAPADKLHVSAGDIRIDGGTRHLLVDHGSNSGNTGIILRSTGANAPFLKWTDGTNNLAGIRTSSSGNFEIQTNGFNTRLLINSSGNVGIGTTDPQAKLNIKIATQGTAASVVAAGTSAGIYLEDDASPTDNYFVSKIHTPGNDTAIGGIKFAVSPDGSNYSWAGIKGLTSTSGNAGNLAFYTSASNTSGDSSTERMRLTAAGRLGIGTSSPQDALDLYDADDNVGIYFHTATSGVGGGDGLRVGLNNTHAFVWSYENTPLSFGTNGSQKATILANGNLGIGTSSPRYNLAVNGSNSTAVGFAMDNTSGGGTLDLAVLGSGYNSHQAGPGEIWLFSPNNINIGGATGHTNNIKFLANNSVNMFIQGSNGNVGIGTTSPGAKLHVAGAIVSEGGSFQSGVEAALTDVGLVVPKNNYIYSDDGTYLRRVIGHASTGIIEIGQGGTALITDIVLKPGSTGNVRFFASGSEDVRINSSGNVGIGTSSPAQKLHVVGSAIIDGGTGVASTGVLNVRQSGDTLNNGIALTSSHATSHRIWKDSTGKLNFGPTSLPSAFVQDLTGKIGIATNAPTEKLHIHGGGIYTTPVTYAGLQDHWALKIGASNNAGWDFAGIKLRVDSGGGPRMSLMGVGQVEAVSIVGGNVGIGTTAPYYKLDTRFSNTNTTLSGGNSGNWGSNGIRIDNTNTTVGAMALAHFRVGDADWHIGNKRVGTDQADFIFANEGATKMLIDHTGNVGIGTTAPDAKLRIDQDAATLGLKVTGGSGGTDIAQFTRDVGGTATVGINAAAARPQMYFTSAGNTFALGVNSNTFEISDNSHIGTTNTRFSITNTGNVGIGTTTPAAQLQVKQLGINVNQSSVASTNQYTCDSMSATIFRSARYTIQITNTTDGTYHLTEMLLIHDGTTPSINEFGTIFTGSAAEAVFTADINSGNVRLLATPASSDAMQFKVVRHSILV